MVYSTSNSYYNTQWTYIGTPTTTNRLRDPMLKYKTCRTCSMRIPPGDVVEHIDLHVAEYDRVARLREKFNLGSLSAPF